MSTKYEYRKRVTRDQQGSTLLTGQRQAPCEAWNKWEKYSPKAHFLRSLLLLLVMMVVGVEDVWGTVTEGVYYIKSYNSYATDFTPEYYLVPTINCFYNDDEDKPHLTTFKTNGDKNSLWRIVPVTGGYRLIHNATGKYLVVNDAISALVTNSQAHRKRVHLETISPNNLDDNSIFTFTEVSGDIDGIIGIKHISRGSSKTGDGKDHYYLNPQNGNHDYYRAASGRAVTDFQGIVGFYGKNVPTTGTDGTDSRWKLYPANNTCANPVIQYNDAGTNIQISYPISDDTGWTIYYTTDGSDPSDANNENRTGIQENTTLTDLTGVSKVRAKATKEGWDSSDEVVLIASDVTQMVQSKECDAFYMVPPMVSGETCATTSNIPNAAMGWRFEPAGLFCGIQYYKILNPAIDNKYLYCSGDNGSDEALIMKSSSEIISDANNETIDRAKFRLIVQDDGSYKFISKWWAAEKPDKYYVNKKNGNNGGNPLNLADGTNNTGQWNVIAAPSTPKTQFDASFASTTTSTKCYLIKSANATTYHLLPPTAEGGYATANTTGANTNWFLLPIEDNDEWIPSYHIKNGKTGEYLYFNSSDSKFYTNSSVSGNENNYKFIIVKSANTTYTNPFNVIPYALKDQANQEDNSLNRSGNNLTIGNSRNTPASLWQLEEGCLEPFFEQSGDNITISYISNTSDVYYTTDGSDPSVSGTLYENGNWPASEQHGIKAIAKLKDNSTVTSEEVTLLNQPEITLGVVGPYPYKGTPWEPGVSSVSVGSISTSTGYSVSYSDNHTNVGDVTVNVADNVEDNTFIWNASTTFTINQKAVTITAKDASKAYDGTALTESGFTATALETGDTHTFTVTMTEGSTITNMGTEPNVIATVDGTAVTTGTETAIGNYLVTTANGTLTINPKPLTITADSDTKVYDGTPLTKNSYTYTELLAGDQIKSVTITGSQTNVGTSNNVPSAAVIKKGETDVTANYNITYTNGTLEVTKKTLTITADAKSKNYGEADPELTYTSEGLVNDDAITGTLTRAVGEEVGIYAITQGSLTAGNNYTISFTGANLIISKAKLTITAKPKTITYGDDPANDGVTYSGLADTDDESVLSGSLTYAYNTVANGTGAAYTKTSEPGSYYIIPSGLSAANYVITFAPGTLTVNPKEVGLTWSETTSFTYDGEEHAPTATATGMVNGDEIGVTVTGAQTNAQTNVEEEDYYKATASALTGDKAGNYKLPATNTQSFTITPKSLVDGTTLADGYILNFGENNTILLTDDVIGSALVLSTDYSVGEDTDPSEGYAIRTVTGINNYTGSFTVRNAFVTFSTDTERDSWSATFVAEKKDDEDIGFVLPEGFSAFIISDIRGEWAIPEPLNYIPADVPVLLVANHQTQGFVVTEASSSEVTITPEQKDKNMLEKVTEDTPGYNATTESVPFETKKIYLLYKNEFVFNKAGNLKKGKVFLNPNHIASSPEPAPARLQIAWNYTTGIELIDNSQLTIDNSVDYWYTLDGRQLQGKPTTKGLYINNGNKVVIK